MAENKTKKRVTTKKVTQSIEDKILGIEPVVTEVENFDYESPSVRYQVTALHDGATPVVVNGTVIEAYIGSTNRDVRVLLKEGAKKVITKEERAKKEKSKQKSAASKGFYYSLLIRHNVSLLQVHLNEPL